MTNILNIESTCDETAISLVSVNCKKNPSNLEKIEILGDTLNSQAVKHAEFGGVFPSLAKREHVKNFVPALEYTLLQGSLLQKAGTKDRIPKEKLGKIKHILSREEELFARLLLFFAQYKKPDIDIISIVSGPGLAPALWVGVNFAKALATAWDLPVIEINHMEGHVYSALFPDDLKIEQKEISLKKIEYPAMALLLSGGHTEIVYMKRAFDYKKIGQTLDDAVGEAYDKVARLIGEKYPGGPAVSKLAENYEKKNLPDQIKFPRPKINDNDLNFSFSGLKTAVLRYVKSLEKEELSDEAKEHIAYAFQNAVTDVVLKKLTLAIQEYNPKTLIFAGGVSANKQLREKIEFLAKANNINLLMPPLCLTGDNALMSALAAASRYCSFSKEAFSKLESLEARSNWEF